MRGAHELPPPVFPPERIIPADAGSTLLDFAALAGWRDHPRGCGEHVENDLAYFEEKGSSPRMRGALERLKTMKKIKRIIPADAGSTPCPAMA